ncbi:cation channel sperm-associated protein subunit epsilon [Echinops telfairi]|uniref:Cation channel sperm-associated protein subunit epsilon n=1 Tax=Echinops telfairi TaxID=9371 RepID=A0ABM0IHK3_ECHTE|nr:cation channel sperm-associated protein subunit epsilon [Echinops telfairi]
MRDHDCPAQAGLGSTARREALVAAVAATWDPRPRPFRGLARHSRSGVPGHTQVHTSFGWGTSADASHPSVRTGGRAAGLGAVQAVGRGSADAMEAGGAALLLLWLSCRCSAEWRLWKITVPMSKDDMIKEIKGNNVAFQNCFIGNSLFLLTFPLVLESDIPGYVSLSLPAGSQVTYNWNTCMPSFVVLVTDVETYQTNDSFHTWSKLRVPPGILSDHQRQKVTQVTLLQDSIFFLIDGGLYLKESRTFIKLGRNVNLPDDRIIGISSRRWCWILYLHKSEKKPSDIAVWTENGVYLGYKRKNQSSNSFRFEQLVTTTKLKHLLHLPTVSALTVHYVEYTVHPVELSIFLNCYTTNAPNKTIFLVLHNEDSKRWIIQDFSLVVPIDTSLVPRYIYSASPELLLWDKHRVYYCYNNLTETGVLQTRTGERNLSRIAKDSTIHYVYLDYFGNIIIKMENNIMFHTKPGVKDVIQLHAWTNKTIKTLLASTFFGNFYIVTSVENGVLHIQSYPLKVELQSVYFKYGETCPYIAFYSSLVGISFTLDKKEILSFWAQVIYPENTGIFIIMESYGPNLLEVKKEVKNEVVLGYCTKTLPPNGTVEEHPDVPKDYRQENSVAPSSVLNQTTGLMIFDVRPSKYSKACTTSEKVFQVIIGCDPEKYIAVKGFSRKKCSHPDFSYVIEKSYLRHQPLEDLKVRYDTSLYGCLWRLDFRREFQPVLQLFDRNGFIEDIKVNFIVWEIHGRNDYAYNTTMKKGGCLNEAQTWNSMIELNKHLPLHKAWGPENYKHCFSHAVGKPGDLNQPYEIINSSNNNYIIWPLDHSGIYVFSAKILDPNYSFCNLTTIFAIETFGFISRPSGYLVASFLFFLMLLFFSVLVLSYFQYMKIYRTYIYEPLHKTQRKQKKL